MSQLVEQYADFPLGGTDAAVIALAERLGTRRVFTLDRDFYVYRFADGTAAEVTP